MVVGLEWSGTRNTPTGGKCELKKGGGRGIEKKKQKEDVGDGGDLPARTEKIFHRCWQVQKKRDDQGKADGTGVAKDYQYNKTIRLELKVWGKGVGLEEGDGAGIEKTVCCGGS